MIIFIWFFQFFNRFLNFIKLWKRLRKGASEDDAQKKPPKVGGFFEKKLLHQKYIQFEKYLSLNSFVIKRVRNSIIE